MNSGVNLYYSGISIFDNRMLFLIIYLSSYINLLNKLFLTVFYFYKSNISIDTQKI